MRQRSLSLISVRTRPADRSRGILRAGHLAIPVVLGRSGIKANKREGDGATPRGCFQLLRLWWRADRAPLPATGLPIRRIDPLLAWCEDPAHRRYNRPFRRDRNESGDRLWREDRLYDCIVEIDYNRRPRVAGRGSAIFLHFARPEGTPTAGCVGFRTGALERLLARLGPKSKILIEP
jgi:L,D-peptidoglycan transpeptidase YkuD (ErfK/YbiS/YcfS/YnhG family)